MTLDRVQFVGAANARTCPIVIIRFYVSIVPENDKINSKATSASIADVDSILTTSAAFLRNIPTKMPFSMVFFNFFGFSSRREIG